MDIKLTHKFPTKDGIYLVQTENNNFISENGDGYSKPFLAEIITDEYPIITVNPVPCFDHNDVFCVDKKDKNNIKWFGPIKFK